MALKDLKLSVRSKDFNKGLFLFNFGIKGGDFFTIFENFAEVEIDLIDIVILFRVSKEREEVFP